MKVKNRAIGSVCELVAHGAGKYITEFAVESEDGSEIATYDTIDELQEYWETYTPIKPLIKDEKIRKAVRAWAGANELSDKLRVINEHFDSCKVLGRCDSRNVCLQTEFKTTIAHANRDQYYTIAELCGEGEAPEPIEPGFIDLDERIRELEEE